MEYKTIAGNFYTITSKSGCSVTDATGTLEETVEAGKQLTVQAPSDKLIFDDEQAIIFKANFKQAALALGLLGGGKNDLPAGYTRLEFLESTGAQRIDTGIAKPAIAKYRIRFTRTNVLQLMGFNSAYDKWGVSDKGKYRNSTNVTAFEAGGVDFITYNDLNYPTVLFSCNGDVESFVANNSYPDGIWSIFAQKDNTYNCYARLYENSYSAKNGTLLGEFIPVLDALGKPCMYDTVSKQAFRNAGAGQFIAGFTLAQARKLGKLPAGTILTISLPVGYDSDAGVVAALAAAEANGCVLTIQTYAAETAAATYSLRRVWGRKVQDENGSYVAADGSRWQVDWCVDIIGADPESLGYERYRSVDAAVAYWELVPYEYPKEELSTIE